MSIPPLSYPVCLLLSAFLIALLLPLAAQAQQVPPGPQALDQRFFTGKAAGDNFGYAVSSAGDVNGDGYDDLIVGAYLNDAVTTNAGAAYIYFGGKIQNLVADVTLMGEAKDDQFGQSVSAAGDVNGDGYDDVIVGAPGNDAGGQEAGRAYVFFGGVSMDNTADIVLTGAVDFDALGVSVASAGDVNGDGYADVIVGAWGNDTGAGEAGQASVFYGGAAMDNTADVVFTGEAAFDQFGVSVSAAGDVNGDGYADVVVGAFGQEGGGLDRGRAYVYYGGAVMDNTADVTLNGEADSDFFGYSVSGAGDVNGDGYADVVVGAYFNDGGGTDAGAAYVFLGGVSMDNTADVKMTGVVDSDLFGISVSGTGDVNGDGYEDVVVGAYFNDASGSAAGQAYVYAGGATMDPVADIILTGEASGDVFGWSVSEAGDVNGDGYADFIVGAYGHDTNGTDAGRAYLYRNSMTGGDLSDATFTGEATGDVFGFSVSDAGDVNGDGYADVIVGAPTNDEGGTDAGRAYLYFGGVAMKTAADVTLTGTSVSALFGISVSSAGDVNGDGYADVIVGETENVEGRAYIYFGGSSMNNVADVTLSGVAVADNFGSSVSSAGDVNGDGYDDVIVGARTATGADQGQAYIYFGGSSMNNVADVTMTGTAPSNNFGSSVSGAGDVNGDGFADVIVGAKDNDMGGIDAGRAYVYYGGVSMSNIPDLIMTGAAAGDRFGVSVSSAGDVNGDGYADVIVGASENGAGGTEAGAAYVYYGNIPMNSTADVVLTGERDFGMFGYSVSGAGDINGDGYSDVIVGTRGERAYAYYGGALMDITADVVMTGEPVFDEFGSSVSSAGDINGDGYMDIIVGALLNGAGGADAGRAYLYLSSPPAIIPRITTIGDVAGDQGGFVHIDWIRSGYDVPGINRITAYFLERSRPPGTSGFAWEPVATIPATLNVFYSYAAPTYSDQTEGNTGTTYFRVTAQTTDPNEFWRSMTASGASIDNLAPLTPQNPALQNTAPETNHLSWTENTTDPDVYGYVVYRSTTDGFTISDSTRLAETTAITYTDDVAEGSQPYFYRLTAKDVHGNESAPTEQLTALTYINLKVFLEGPYQNGGTMRTDLLTAALIPLEQPYGRVEYLDTPSAYVGEEAVTTLPAGAVDWVLVEVRSGTAGADSLTTRAGLLMSDGRIRDLDGSSALAFGSLAEGSYYVVVRHRNHLAVMSAVPVAFSATSVPSLYDFTTGAGQAYGVSAMTEVEAGVWGLYSGDGDASGGVTASDQALWLGENGLNGYQVGDYNLSGGNTASDQALWLGNNGLNSQVPE